MTQDLAPANEMPRSARFLKRVLDLTLSVALLALLFLPMCCVAVLVGLVDGFPVLFRQERLGRGGVTFTMLKFRTMRVGAENEGTGLFSFEGDPRVTRLGKVLRATSLDELPQLFNIVRGEMALVGPRPPVVGELDDDFLRRPATQRRFQLRPGITGLAQVSGRNELEWHEKIVYDNEYLERVSVAPISTDAAILARSVAFVGTGRGVVEPKR